jgi:hypothetical protein
VDRVDRSGGHDLSVPALPRSPRPCKASCVEHRTSEPAGGPHDGTAPRSDDASADPLVGELHRERRDRRVLVVATAIGIITGAVAGLALMLGVLGGSAATEQGGGLRHGALLVVLGPPIVSLATGHAIFTVRRRRRGR